MAPGRFVPWAVRKAVLERDQGCVYCGKSVARMVLGEWYGNADARAWDEEGRSFHFDHPIPVSRGGESTVENVALACEKCNLKKATGDSPRRIPREQLPLFEL